MLKVVLKIIVGAAADNDVTAATAAVAVPVAMTVICCVTSPWLLSFLKKTTKSATHSISAQCSCFDYLSDTKDCI